ncbi:MAG: ABC transporter permease [Paracoccus sp. (in: a-proteobacteria)]|uniref:ABC transporter permease n=1 Tax=Paracoccus sp. TaxID=267 RepID=UPI0026DFB8B0|nr:ABC transporter permease [Paracoccus sp. (in: a-proteobacteria)]MDO5621965.1 ABC transporter permease [Paracoccus sp. (in: a-proteobacteria)]
MLNLHNILHLGIKELRGLLRDPVMLILIVYSFTLSVYTTAQTMPDGLANATISIVDEDQSQLSSRITASFTAPYFMPPLMIGTGQVDARMDAGMDTFSLTIPPDFERDLLAGHGPSVQLNVDATRMTQAFTGAGYIQQIVSGEVGDYLAGHSTTVEMPVGLDLRARYNPTMDGGWFGAINSVIQSITMLTIILTGAALIREKEHGTVEHLLVMPVTVTEIMLSKIWSMGLVVLLASGFSIAVVVQMLLKVPVQGSVPLFMAGAVLMIVASACLGIFIATAAGTMPQFGLLMIMVLLPLQMLSGGMTPRESMPELVQFIMLAAPNTHFVILSQAILFRGAGFDIVWPQFIALAMIGAALFWLALLRFRGFLR